MIRPPLRGKPVEPALDLETSTQVDPPSELFIVRPPNVPHTLPPASIWISQHVPFEPICPCNGLLQLVPPFVDRRIPELVAIYSFSLLAGSVTIAPTDGNVEVADN